MQDSTDGLQPSYPDIPLKLTHVPNDAPGEPDTIRAQYIPGLHARDSGHPITFCEIDERSWAIELVRRWNSFVSRDKLIEDARLCAAEMKCAADEAEDESAPTVASEYRGVAIVLIRLANTLDKDTETAELAARGAGVIEAVEGYMREAEDSDSDNYDDRLGTKLFHLRHAWLVFKKVHD